MNITQKLYTKIHLNGVLVYLYFLYIVYFGVVISHKMFFSCLSTSSLHLFQDSFLKGSWGNLSYVIS